MKESINIEKLTNNTDLLAWINKDYLSKDCISFFQNELRSSELSYIVIDDFFNEAMFAEFHAALQQEKNWRKQRHLYSGLYVDDGQWRSASEDELFVQRDEWQPKSDVEVASKFKNFLRSEHFLKLLSLIFSVKLSDKNIDKNAVNTNFFRLSSTDFVKQHADESPNREVCMLVYFNKDTNKKAGGELCFSGSDPKQPIKIQPCYNRCVLFNPASKGSEHWVNAMSAKLDGQQYRYNITSWYWSE